LQQVVSNCEGGSQEKPVPDLHASGRDKLAAASLATFNKKVQDMASGVIVPAENDDPPVPEFGDQIDQEIELDD
jgi:hypothetical protein